MPDPHLYLPDGRIAPNEEAYHAAWNGLCHWVTDTILGGGWTVKSFDPTIVLENDTYPDVVTTLTEDEVRRAFAVHQQLT